jgi:prepilin-type N-terminal cleavage/methylation domain-containing protein
VTREVNRVDGFSLLEMLVVTAVTATLAGMAMPTITNMISNFQINGDARALTNSLYLARMQAAANFSRTRVYVNLSTKTFHSEIKTGTTPWTRIGQTISLSSNNTFNFGGVATPPPNTQGAIGQAGQCLDDSDPPEIVANTACVMFNSRGVPIDTANAPTGEYALYITDGASVMAATVSATGNIRLWRTQSISTGVWTQQ